jgi:Tfp pilus assembly protein PilO
MIDSSHGIPLLRRVAAEHQRVLLVLGLVCLANVLVYALLVYPLSQQVANVEQRDQDAERALTQARVEHARAEGTLTGKARASTELATFYSDVLPRDLAGARRLTFLRLAQLARETNLQYERASYEPDTEDGSTLTRLQIQMVLLGAYPDMRDFMYRLETAPEFVVIDNVQLDEDSTGDGSLVVTLDLSTYYRGETP